MTETPHERTLYRQLVNAGQSAWTKSVADAVAVGALVGRAIREDRTVGNVPDTGIDVALALLEELNCHREAAALRTVAYAHGYRGEYRRTETLPYHLYPRGEDDGVRLRRLVATLLPYAVQHVSRLDDQHAATEVNDATAVAAEFGIELPHY